MTIRTTRTTDCTVPTDKRVPRAQPHQFFAGAGRQPFSSVMLAKASRQPAVASSGPQLTTMNSTQTLFNRRKALWAAGALALAGAFAAGAQSSTKPVVEIKRDTHVVNRGTLESASFSSVVKRVAPSVVKITTETK